MKLSFLRTVIEENRAQDAVVWNDQAYSYQWLLDRMDFWHERVSVEGVEPGTVTIIEAAFSPNAIALFLALTESSCILVPLATAVEASKPELIDVAQGEVSFIIDEGDDVQIQRHDRAADHELYRQLRERGHAGLVLFSSGSTGAPKGAVHDMTPLLAKFTVPRRSLRCITFLLYDHIGGINTMLYSLSNGGCMIAVQDRSPDAVLTAVERHRVELLPVSPTFLNLIILSEAYSRHDLSSLRVVTYGTEPMPESTLRRFHELFPEVRLQQTYGLSELGILRSKSKGSDSLWVKIGGEGFETRVVDGILQIKARSAMLGYLNAPSPFTEDGWLDTGDAVEVDGEYLRILGRESEIINVGGEKVYPAEVESVIQERANVAEVTVFGEENAITGQIVCARVRMAHEQDHKEFVAELKRHCHQRLQRYKVPVKVSVVEAELHGERFKKIRRAEGEA